MNGIGGFSSISFFSLPNSQGKAGEAEKEGGLSKDLFAAMDADGNGKLSAEEFKAARQELPFGAAVDGKTDPEKSFAKLDADGDGSLSFKEAKPVFDRVATELNSSMQAEALILQEAFQSGPNSGHDQKFGANGLGQNGGIVEFFNWSGSETDGSKGKNATSADNMLKAMQAYSANDRKDSSAKDLFSDMAKMPELPDDLLKLIFGNDSLKV